MTLLEATLPILPPTQNQLLRMHFRDRARHLDDLFLLIPNCPLHARQAVGTIRRVAVTFHKSRGPLSDEDNLHARCKLVLDALVKRHWMIDDSPAYITQAVSEEITGAKETVITVADAPAKKGTEE